jgi:uncharacterized damage-inducible protein DinB
MLPGISGAEGGVEPMSTATLRSLFGYKAWADRELFQALSGLSPEHAEPLHTCIRTLNHIHVVDRLFQARLIGEPVPFEATNTSVTPTLAQLQSDVTATDAWFERYLAEIEPDVLDDVIDFEFTDGDRGRMNREEILLHVIAHGAYHRGNVGQVLKSLSVAPPRDLYTRFLHQSEPERRAFKGS